MTLNDVIRTAGDRELAMFLSVASDLNTLVRGFDMAPQIKPILAWLDVPENRVALADRLTHWNDELCDPTRLHPDDITIAVLLLSLYRKDPILGLAAAQLIRSADRKWWSRRIAEVIVSHSQLMPNLLLVQRELGPEWGFRREMIEQWLRFVHEQEEQLRADPPQEGGASPGSEDFRVIAKWFAEHSKLALESVPF